MPSRASENLRAAADQVVADVHELPLPQDVGKAILGAIERFASVVTTEFEAVQRKLAESAVREDPMHECVERLIKLVDGTEKKWETRFVERERVHAEQHVRLHEGLANLREEVRALADVLGSAAMVARTEATEARDRAEAAERYVRDSTFDIRANRDSEPAIPSVRRTTLPEAMPAFESGPPPSRELT